MGHIKLKILYLFLTLFLLTNAFFTNQNNVKAAQIGISFVGEPTYRLIKNIIKDNKVIGKNYEINVTLHNSDMLKSDELNVNLTDEEGFTLSKKIILEPSETRIVSFAWSTAIIKNQKIFINYCPSNPNVVWTQYNSGSKQLTIYITENKGVTATNTPGFELILIFIAIIIAIILDQLLYKKH